MAKDVNLTSQEWCDIVFEEKNKEYGAYQIRRASSKRHWIALGIVFLLAIFIAFLPLLVKTVVEATKPPSDGLTETAVIADLDKMEDLKEENTIPQQEAPPPPPLKSTIKFTAPVITASEDMKEDDGMKSQEELANTKLQISIADVQGTDDKHGIDIADLDKNKVIVEDKKEEIFRVVEKMPEYPGGETEMMEFLRKNIKYPERAREDHIEGRVTVQFVVNPKGEISQVEAVRSPHPYLSNEAVRVVKLMPNWSPGNQNGKNVSTYVRVPINFSLK